MDATPEAIFFASPFTSSTLASWGATIQYQTVSDISFECGLFQVPPNINSPQWRGTDFGIGGDDGYMMLAQASWSLVFCGNLGGLYQAGGYFFDGYEMAYLDGSGRSRSSGYGFYLQGQQTVWACGNNPSQNITLWAGAQYAPLKRISPVQWQVYAGMQFQGFIPRRSGDSIFVSWTSGFFSGEYNGGASTQETVLELNYLWQLNANISLQPVLQFVLNSGGSGETSDAVVWGGQVMVSF